MTWIARTVFGGIIGIGVGVVFWNWQFGRPVLKKDQQVVIDLPTGSSVRTLARTLNEQEVAWRLKTRLAAWWYLGGGKTLKAGRYVLEGPMSWEEMFNKLHKGEVVPSSITFIEGKRWRDIRSQLKKNEWVADVDFLTHSEAAIVQVIHESLIEKKKEWVCPPDVLEGCLMPDTYALQPGTSSVDLLVRAYIAMDLAVRKAWLSRDLDLPLLSPYEMLILASIVEKETALDEDRPRVARVFINRLKRGMRLQSDPTVIYGAANYEGNITRAHLRTDHPYNTYTRGGLTPTPIAMPGRASLNAVAHPEPGKWLYFVASSKGRSVFSENLSDHNDAVRKYQLMPARKKIEPPEAFAVLPRVHE